MTLAVGFRCTDGLVLAVDSEIGDGVSKYEDEKSWIYRYPPQDENQRLKVGIVGAGDLAFVRYAAERIGHELNADMGKDDVQSVVQGVINQIHLEHLYPYPDQASRPEIFMLVGCLARDGNRLITTSLTTVTKVVNFETLGIGRPLANFLIKRFYTGRIEVASGIFVSTQVLMHARRNVARVGGDSQIIVMYRDTNLAGTVSRETIKENEEFLANFERAIEPLMFKGSAIGVTDEEYRTVVQQLHEKLLSIRDLEFVQNQAQKVFDYIQTQITVGGRMTIQSPSGHLLNIRSHPPVVLTDHKPEDDDGPSGPTGPG